MDLDSFLDVLEEFPASPVNNIVQTLGNLLSTASNMALMALFFQQHVGFIKKLSAFKEIGGGLEYGTSFMTGR